MPDFNPEAGDCKAQKRASAPVIGKFAGLGRGHYSALCAEVRHRFALCKSA